MEQKHTPGPWKIWKEETQDTDLNILIEGEDGLPFCNVYDTPNEDIGWSHNRARKRAELIAQAPDLLAKVSEQQREIERLKSEHKSLRLSVQRFHQTLIARNYNNIGVWHNERQQYNFELITEVETILTSKT